MQVKKAGIVALFLISAVLLSAAGVNYINYFRTKPGDPIFPKDADQATQALKEVLIQNEIASVLRDPSNAKIHFANDLFRDVELKLAREYLNRGVLLSVGGVLSLGVAFFLSRKSRINRS